MPVKGKGGELTFLAATIVAALFFLEQAFNLPMTMRGSLGPGLYPALVLVCILLVATAILARILTTREIRVFSPFLEGLEHDTAMRRLAVTAGRILATPVRVVARTGSGWFSAFAAARRAPADGWTLALVTSETADLPDLEAAAFALDAFEPVARLWSDPDAVVVRADAPWTDLAALFGDPPSEALRIGFVQSERAAAPVRAWLGRHAARFVEAVDFDTPATLLQALRAGRLDAALMAVSEAEGGLAAGRLRCLAALSDEPVRIRGGALVTSRQQGFPLASGRWGGLMLPRGARGPADTARVEQLCAAFTDASLRGAAPRPGDAPADLAERPRWSILPPAEFAHFLTEMWSHALAFDPGARHPTLPHGKVAGLALAAGGLLLFPLVMGALGFPLAATLFLATLMLLLWTGLDLRALVTIACVALGAALFLDHLFGEIFHVMFPSGVIWGS